MTRVVRWLLSHFRRWRVRHELYSNAPEQHPALAALTVGEVLPWKGTHWRIAAIHTQPCPAIILVPTGETRASKLGRLVEMRRVDRIVTKAEEQARHDVDKYARAATRGRSH